MRQFGLIGFPISQSFSPGYFSDKFEKEGLTDCRYDAFPLQSIDLLPNLLKDVPALEGLNVTSPYKSQVIPYLHELSEEAAEIGAVNVIKIKNGHLTGYNSDVFGFEKSLFDFLPNPIPSELKALVLGTGGASKATQFVLKKLGIHFQLVSRHPSPTTIVYENISPAIFDAHKLIINATPLGMMPNINDCPPIPYGFAGPDHYFFDLIYNPEKSSFLNLAETAGSNIQNGLPMLYLQAERAWDIWQS
ncbi:MAG: shikimate dehydrogenase [Saprospiraceae bacterium]|nr:shikimate dehydrogenase [Saprospiraceae bacterium]MCF8251372.1 shikimate dehydrogenase [Saprospiraceae bacterium]MCF8280547.1 shikimate dehydrogenase [Bacteroidales bacterium]MCF8313235.1 shikimate dehydrogenase [Saprospiraceae bacterium]MCF8441682.1 shikimate dehydrogenase [Saprospiraceae bacterium]